MHHRTLRAATTALVALIAAALVASGCGGGSEGPSGTVPKADREEAAPKEVTPPEQDPALDADMGKVGEQARTAGCSFGRYEEEDPEHVDRDDLSWDTFPPASGRHLETWAPWGLYDEQVADGFAVHNLEHGGIVVWIGADAPDDADDRVEELLDEGEKWLVAPREDLEGITAVAWAMGLTCPPRALEALDESGEDALTDLLEMWFEVAGSTGSEAEKDIKAVPGSMAEPTPRVDTSVDP